MHTALWKMAYLARPVRLSQVVMTIAPAQMTLASNFSYGAEEAAAKEPAGANAKNAAAKEATGKGASKGAAGQDSAGQAVRGSTTESSDETGRAVAKAAGTIDGTVQVIAPLNCGGLGAGLQGIGAGCEPQIQLRLGAMNAAAVEAALAGPPQEKGIFAPLIDRMRSPDRPKWPEATVSVHADSLVLGPATLQKPVIRLHLKATQIDVQSWEAELLGGSAKGTGSFAWTDDKPQYSLEGSFSRLNAAPVGGLINAVWSGGPVSGTGSVQLSGLTAKDLAASASGTVHFDWLHGVLIAGNAPASPAPATPAQNHSAQDRPAENSAAGNADAQAAPEARRGVETKFDDWSGDLSIAGGKAQIGKNTLLAGKRSSSLEGTITLGAPAKISIASVAAKPVVSAGKASAAPAVK
jgi:hypothetical protein